MAIQLVTIVNPNGRKGRVSATSPAAAVYKQPPSTRQPDADKGGDVDALPAGNASTESWQQYAATHGLSSDEAAGMSRDDLVAHFTKS